MTEKQLSEIMYEVCDSLDAPITHEESELIMHYSKAIKRKLEAGQHETIVMVPCPFCSGDAIINKRKNGNFEVGCDSKECYGWSCNDSLCECEDGFTSKRKAIEKWNQRAT